MTPHLVKWDRLYRDQGLRVIEVDNGQMDGLAALEKHLGEAAISFPVFHDATGDLSQQFRITGYPTAFLVGRQGEVIWSGNPGNVVREEQLIKQALQP